MTSEDHELIAFTLALKDVMHAAKAMDRTLQPDEIAMRSFQVWRTGITDPKELAAVVLSDAWLYPPQEETI